MHTCSQTHQIPCSIGLLQMQFEAAESSRRAHVLNGQIGGEGWVLCQGQQFVIPIEHIMASSSRVQVAEQFDSADSRKHLKATSKNSNCRRGPAGAGGRIRVERKLDHRAELSLDLSLPVEAYTPNKQGAQQQRPASPGQADVVQSCPGLIA